MNINRTTIITFQAFLVLTTLTQLACSGTPDNMVVIDSVLHVMNSTDPLEPNLPITFDLQTIIGVDEGAEEYMFSVIVGIEVDEEGRLYVLEAREEEVRVFRPDGTWSHTIGRKGQGPGELMNVPVEGMRLSPDGNLWITDLGRNQISIFTRSGDFLRDIRTSTRMPLFIEPIEDGFLGVLQGTTPSENGIDIIRDNHLNRFSLEADSLANVVTSRLTINPLRMDIRLLTRNVPILVLDDQKRIWQTFWRHDEYKISVFGLDGSVDRVVLKEFEQIRKSEEELARERSMYERTMARMGGGELPPEFELPEIDPFKSTIKSLYLDPHGYIWVQVNVSGTTLTNTFDLFDMDGLFVTRYVIEDHEHIDRLRIRGDRLYLISSDNEGIPQVYVYAIRIPKRG